MFFATYVRNKGVLCASARSPQNRLTALWAVGRFLPWWASSPAWQRRLDVIKVYTLSAVWVCVKWALLLPKAWTVIVYLHCACEITKKGSQDRRPGLHIHLVVSFTCLVLIFQMFFFLSVFKSPSVVVEGWWGSHILNKEILLVSLSWLILTVWKKASEKYDRSC